jgi:hypothetical protein
MRRAADQAAQAPRSGAPDRDARITDDLALKVLGWRSAADRYLKPDRCWLTKWRFRPFECLEDAFQLLERAADRYVLSSDGDKIFAAEVRIGRHTGRASGRPRARTITTAIARALGMEV